MRKIPGLLVILISFLSAAAGCPELFSQQMSDVSSDHLLLRLPKERALLGRDIITDLERFYSFLDGAIGVKLPRRIIVLVDWDQKESRTNYREVSIIVGMNQPGVSNAKFFLLKESMREIARLGLLELSHGADRPDYEFLYEGMIEILVDEYNHTSRRLESAWVLSHLLDEMGQLGFNIQRSWSDFSGDHRCFRNAAPGITFLLTFRDLKGRERPGKFFEGLKRANLSKSLEEAFGDTLSELENIWLNKVREYRAPNDITISDNEAPLLTDTLLLPDSVHAGGQQNIRFSFKKNGGVLLAEGVFVRDEHTGKVFQAQAESDYILGTIPVNAGTAPGQYKYSVTAIDESGNLRRWNGTYTVE
jgi:hypothetical protein